MFAFGRRCEEALTREQNDQRQRRRDEAAAGTSWDLVRFEYVESDEEYRTLADMLHDKLTPSHEDGYIFKG